MYRFDPQALHLALEFRARPIGQHSPELERLLTLMRNEAIAGKYCLICTKPHEEWVLARLSGIRGVGPTILKAHRFDSIEAAEWAVFKLRWRRLGGVDLNSASIDQTG
jgi:hypothetical protein